MTPSQEKETPAELQWKRLRKLRLVGTRFNYLTRVTPIDTFLSRTVLRLIPTTLSPNSVTLFRFVCVPIVLLLILTNHAGFAFGLFLVAAASDALDGAMARTRKQITKWGIIADPIADKLLIGTVAVTVISKYLSWKLTLAIVSIELVLVLTAYLRYRGTLMPAKTMGKIKMILQCVGVAFVLLYTLYPVPAILTIARYTLYVAVLFAMLSLLAYRSI